MVSQARRALVEQDAAAAAASATTAAEVASLRAAAADADARAASSAAEARAARQQASAAEAQLAAAAPAAGELLRRELQETKALLAERQAVWEAGAAEKAARVLSLERQLHDVRPLQLCPASLLA